MLAGGGVAGVPACVAGRHRLPGPVPGAAASAVAL